MALPSTGGDKAIGSQQDEVERLLRAQRNNERWWFVDGREARRGDVVTVVCVASLPHCSFSFRSMWSAVEEKQRCVGWWWLIGGGGVHCQIWGFFWYGLWWSCGGDGDYARDLHWMCDLKVFYFVIDCKVVVVVMTHDSGVVIAGGGVCDPFGWWLRVVVLVVDWWRWQWREAAVACVQRRWVGGGDLHDLVDWHWRWLWW